MINLSEYTFWVIRGWVEWERLKQRGVKSAVPIHWYSMFNECGAIFVVNNKLIEVL